VQILVKSIVVIVTPVASGILPVSAMARDIFKRFLFLALSLGCTASAMASPPAGATHDSGLIESRCVAGTLVAMEGGAKPIEKVAAGDRVFATDLQTRKSGYHKVIGISTEESEDLVTVRTFSRESIECAPASLFWVNAKGWIAAKSLFPGNQLLQRDGTFTQVFNVIPEHAPKTAAYSLEVEGFHTFYVGKAGVLVHNAPLGPDVGTEHHAMDQIRRGQ
jgi:hypothetical protein